MIIKKSLFNNVIFYPANLITYFRYLLLVPICYLVLSSPILVTIIYLSFAILDLCDGKIAKLSGKKSCYGAILDMVIDRLGFSIGAIALSILYPNYSWVFYLILSIDLTSHYILIYSSSLLQIRSHKNLFKQSKSTILSNYYSDNRLFMIFTNASLIAGLMAFYLYHFYPTHYLFYFCLLTLFIAPIQIFINILQLYYALKLIIKKDTKF